MSFLRMGLAALMLALPVAASAYPALLLYAEDAVHIRARPDTRSAIVQAGDNGQIYEILAQTGNWYRIRVPGKAAAYVHRSQGLPIHIYEVHAVDGAANLRAEPDSRSPVYDRLPNGTQVEGISRHGNWIGVTYDAAVFEAGAYIHRSRLRDAPRPR